MCAQHLTITRPRGNEGDKSHEENEKTKSYIREKAFSCIFNKSVMKALQTNYGPTDQTDATGDRRGTDVRLDGPTD